MATSVTDKLFEALPRQAGKIGAGGVTSTSATTVPHTFVGLTEGHVYLVTANRTNATGTVKNPINLTETFIGKVSAGNFIECVRQVEGVAQAWAADTVLEILFTATAWNKLLDHLLVQHNQDGTHKGALVTTLKATGAEINTGTEDAKIVTPKAIADSTIAKVPATAAEVAAGTDNAKFVSALSAVPLTNNSLYRQAIINGNFDVWQRGTSFTQAAGLGASAGNRYGYTADRWYNQFYGGVGNSGDYTVTVSQQAFTLGQTDVPNEPKYFHRVAITGVATLGSNTGVLITTQRIESVRTLAGKKATVSFYAKADVNRTIGVVLSQNFGTGGSPSAHVEATESTTINLTNAWQKFSVTFNVPSISGKTLGSNNDHYLELAFVYYKQDNNVYAVPSGAIGAHAASTYDIAQVQLCAGDVALPFMPKSFEEELRACQRYCYAFTADNSESSIGTGFAATGNTAFAQLHLPVPLRTTPTLTATATDWKLTDGGTPIDLTALSIQSNINSSISPLLRAEGTGLTQYRPYIMAADGTPGRLLILSAEL